MARLESLQGHHQNCGALRSAESGRLPVHCDPGDPCAQEATGFTDTPDGSVRVSHMESPIFHLEGATSPGEN